MAQFKRIFYQDLTKRRIIHHCEDVVFGGDNLSDKIGVYLYDNGEPYAGGGTVSGTVINSRGQTVPITTGEISGNLVTVTLEAAALAVPGIIGVYVKLTSGQQIATVLSAMFSAMPTETDQTIDPGTIIPSVNQLITDIETARDSIPPVYTELLAAVAPTFSASTAYTAGSYVWQGGSLYRFTADHAAGSWTGTDAAAAVLGSDVSNLKSAITNTEAILATANIVKENATIYIASGQDFAFDTASKTRVAIKPVYVPNGVTLKVHARGFGKCTYTTSTDGVTISQGGSFANAVSFNHEFAGPIYFRLLFANVGDATIAPNDVTITITNQIEELNDELKDIKSAMDQIGRNGIKYDGYTFVSGNIGGTGGVNSNNNYIRSYGGTQPQAQIGDYFIILPPYQGIVHVYSVKDQVTTKWLGKINSTAKTGIIPIPDTIVGNYISVAVQKTGYLSDDISADIATIGNYVYLIRGNGVVDGLDDLADALTSDETKIVNNRGDIELTFRNTYSPELTLASGTIAPGGAAGNNANFIRTNTASFQIIEDGDYIYVGGDYEIVRAVVYNSRSMSSTGFHALLMPATTNKHSLSIPSAYIGKYIGFAIQKTSMIGQDISAYVDDATANTHYYSPGNGKKEISILSNKVGALENELPDYYFANNYLPGRITEINNNRVGLSPNSLEFVWFTDLHLYDVDGNARNGLQSVNLCRYVAKNANVTSVYCGGDLVDNRLNDGMTKVGCLEALGKARAYLDPIWNNTCMIIGNHEWNDPNGQVETNRLTIGAIVPATTYDSYKYKNAKTIFNGKQSLYGSYAVDDDNYKVRTIFLGCSNSNSLYKAEYEWLAEVLRTTPSGYNVLMMSHIGFAEAPQTSAALLDRFALVVGMLEAAESKNEEYRFTLGTTTVGPFDFSGCNLSVIACITGHTHFDLSMVTTGGTLVISTTADTGPGPGSSDDYRNARVLGTITEQAVDVVQIDLDNKKIFMTRIGGSYDGSAPLANPDREFNF